MRIIVFLASVFMAAVCLVGGSQRTETCSLTLRLTDSETGRTLPGLLRITDADKQPVAIPELLSRGLGLADDAPISRWSVVLDKTTLRVPRGKLTLHAFSGLETELATVAVDCTDRETADATVPLKRFHHAASHGYRSANTHLHLMKLNREQSDRYLLEVPQADGLDVLFVSYLERADADRDYITNRYTRAELEALGRKSGVAIGNGEEHRHNFTAQGQGYGHVMLLDIEQLVQPVSIGPGIAKRGTDGLPVQRGIDQARRGGATIIWCHNNWGVEHIPNWVTGRLHAQNIFDGGTHGSYKDSFYRVLNAGFRVPFSTGTDWFMYDFARVYVAAENAVTPKSWLTALTEGKSFITNGPFLEFKVAGRGLGSTVKLPAAGEVEVMARGVGRVDFERIEIVQNGRAIKSQPTRGEGKHFVADLRFTVPVTAPCWLALRTPPPPVKDDPELQAPVPFNELGQPLFSHTSPVYVEVAGRGMFDATITQALLAEVERNMAEIEKQAVFADAQERSRVLEVHAAAADALRKRIP